MANDSYPDVHITGPVHHYVRVNNAGTGFNGVWYLGTAEVTPQMQRRRYTQNVMNDLAGKTLPFQKTFDGEAATVSALLTYFSKNAWTAMLLAGFDNGLVAGVGRESRWSRGAAVYGQLSFELWQIYDNWFNPAGSSIDLEIGWYWPQVELLQHDTIKAGSQGEALLCVFDCTPIRLSYKANDVGIGNRPDLAFDANNPGGWMLYSNDDTNTTFFPADVRVPQ